MQRLATLLSRITGSLAWVAPLLTRLVIGVALFYTGRGKLNNLDRTATFFSGLGIPLPYANAVFVSVLELVGGLCLVAGLGTRIFSLLLSCSLLVAVLTADREDFVKKFPADLTDVTSFVFLLFLIWLFLFGAGLLSVDYLIGKRLRPSETSDNRS